jgi:hypothetical protein
MVDNYRSNTPFNYVLIYELRDECDDVVHYQDYLDSIDAQAKSMSTLSVFANPDTFNYRSIQRTPPAYANMRSVQPVFDVSRGVLLATENNFTDILCGVLVLFAVLSVIISDREQGMSGLLFSMKNGRATLMLSKIGALAIALFAVTAVIYGENFIVAAKLYGLGDLTRAIQSVNGFLGCNLKISVGGYLLLYVLFKWAALLSVGMVLTLIAVNVRSTVPFYGISAIVLLAEGLAYGLIHPLSAFSIFRCLNLIAFTRGNEIFSTYRNINLFGYPVSLLPATFVTVTVIILLCGGLSAWFYAGKRNLEYRRLVVRLGWKKAEKKRSPLYYTFYKSLLMQKGLPVLLVFAVVAALQSMSFVKQYDITDAYYRYYCNMLEGEITQQTLDYCESEQTYFDEIQAQLDEIQQSGTGMIATQELNEKLYPIGGFTLLTNRMERTEDVQGRQIFYDTGYLRMFGMAGYDDDMRYALPAVLLCIFLISPLFAADNRCRMRSVIYATRTGRRQYILRNVLATCLYAAAALLLWMIPYIVTVSRYYGKSGLSAPLQSIAEFTDFPLPVSVWQYLLLLALLRLAGIVLMALVMLWISGFCRNVTTAVLINLAVFALPVLIYLFGSDFAVNLGFNPLLSANVLLNSFSLLHLLLPIVCIVIVVTRCILRKVHAGSL